MSATISNNVHLGGTMTLSCNGNRVSRKVKEFFENKIGNVTQELRACVFKPPFDNKATRFTSTTQLEGGRIR